MPAFLPGKTRRDLPVMSEKTDQYPQDQSSTQTIWQTGSDCFGGTTATNVNASLSGAPRLNNLITLGHGSVLRCSRRIPGFDLMIRSCIALVLLTGTLTFLPVAAMSCGFHTMSVRESVVSSLMDGTVVVMATTDPEMPFQYKASEAIKGDLTAAEIPFLVDSTTRRKLGTNADDRVLFAKNAKTGRWARLAYIDASNRKIFQHILSNLEAWSSQSVSRYQFFGSLLSHKEPSIRNMALTELDQAPYSILQTLDTSSDTF